jgi:hypothetical protein
LSASPLLARWRAASAILVGKSLRLATASTTLSRVFHYLLKHYPTLHLIRPLPWAQGWVFLKLATRQGFIFPALQARHEA